ncbi:MULTISPECIES: outer membrane protein OmpW [Shewanella]|uniref:Outer membrane protein W n=2 Tax=Shewanella TaxID=22 RepID=A0A974XMH7_9GAMM|nr:MULTISPECIES: outer membrane protein OmpW [Shewanella]QSX31135.1 outer membrane protein OmpW [Shewanella cyperi]QSX38362.1 outer membrane protein OmpW [Shewanella sedimentimangrovi]QSX41915.1 outer membrane protein OmpW [Shewanella cyperi]
MMKKSTLSAVIAATLLSAAPAMAHQAGDILVRAGVATVAPNESSPVVAGVAEFGVSNNTQLGLNFGYMLTDNWAVELLAATPFSHDVSLGALGKIAETKHLPPTLMAQYYFGNAKSNVRPYVGFGINYTNFYDTNFTNDLDGALTDLSLSTSLGWAAHAGLDYQLNDKWMLNASVWYAKIDTDVKFKLAGEAVKVNTDIDPWVYMVSVGYSF